MRMGGGGEEDQAVERGGFLSRCGRSESEEAGTKRRWEGKRGHGEEGRGGEGKGTGRGGDRRGPTEGWKETVL